MWFGDECMETTRLNFRGVPHDWVQVSVHVPYSAEETVAKTGSKSKTTNYPTYCPFGTVLQVKDFTWLYALPLLVF